MDRTSANSSRGFSLIELLVALAVGTLVVGAAVKLFTQGMNATFVVSQRAEMQQDLRATSNLLLKDISLAGAGLPSGDRYRCCHRERANPSMVSLPVASRRTTAFPGAALPTRAPRSCGPCLPTLYGLIPGWRLGITVPGSPNPSDVITVVYTDTVFALPCYTVTGDHRHHSNRCSCRAPLPATCILPPPLVAPQASQRSGRGLSPRATWF